MRRKQMGTRTQPSRLSTKPNRRLELLPAAAGAAAALASELTAGGASLIFVMRPLGGTETENCLLRVPRVPSLIETPHRAHTQRLTPWAAPRTTCSWFCCSSRNGDCPPLQLLLLLLLQKLQRMLRAQASISSLGESAACLRASSLVRKQAPLHSSRLGVGPRAAVAAALAAAAALQRRDPCKISAEREDMA